MLIYFLRALTSCLQDPKKLVNSSTCDTYNTDDEWKTGSLECLVVVHERVTKDKAHISRKENQHALNVL